MADNNMDRMESFETAPQPKLCTNNCGFFASSAGLCSKCHRDAQLKQQQQQQGQAAQAQAQAALQEQQQPATTTTTPQVQELPVASPPAAAQLAQEAQASLPSPSSAPSVADASAPPAKSPSRCAHPECKKKVGLTGFKCKCDGVFCGAHRLAEDHACPFDFKTIQRQKLAAANPVVQAAKVQKI